MVTLRIFDLHPGEGELGLVGAAHEDVAYSRLGWTLSTEMSWLQPTRTRARSAVRRQEAFPAREGEGGEAERHAEAGEIQCHAAAAAPRGSPLRLRRCSCCPRRRNPRGGPGWSSRRCRCSRRRRRVAVEVVLGLVDDAVGSRRQRRWPTRSRRGSRRRCRHHSRRHPRRVRRRRRRWRCCPRPPGRRSRRRHRPARRCASESASSQSPPRAV